MGPAEGVIVFVHKKLTVEASTPCSVDHAQDVSFVVIGFAADPGVLEGADVIVLRDGGALGRLLLGL